MTIRSTIFRGFSSIVPSFCHKPGVNPPPTTTPPPPPLVIARGALPNVVTGGEYTEGFSATGGTGSGYAWSGNGFPGVDFSQVSVGPSHFGALAGTATTPGTYDVAVTVHDDATPTPNSVTVHYTVNVFDPVIITTGPMPNGTVGTLYTQTVDCTGGVLPIKWTVTGVQIPGVNPDGSTSRTLTLSGVPTGASNGTFRVRATDAIGNTIDKAFSPAISNPLTMPAAIIPAGVQNSTNYNVTLTAVGGRAPYAWTTSGTVPHGCAVNPSATLATTFTGTPDTVANNSFRVTCTDADGRSAFVDYTVNVTAPVQTPVYNLLYNGDPNNYTGTALNGATISGNPVHIWVDPTTNILQDPNRVTPSVTFWIDDPTMSGPPYAVVANNWAGTEFAAPFDFAGSGLAWDSNSLANGQHQMTIKVVKTDLTTVVTTATFIVANQVTLPVIDTTTLPAATVGARYTAPLASHGGSQPFTWGIQGGGVTAFPGVTINTSTGVLDGTPTTPDAAATFTATLVDHNGNSTTQTFTVVVSNPVFSILTGSVPAGVKNVTYPGVTFTAQGGTAPYTWRYKPATPTIPGLTFTGAVLGAGQTPTTEGTYNIVVQCTDNNGAGTTIEQAYTVNIALTASLDNWSLRQQAKGLRFAWDVSPGSYTAGDFTFGKIAPRISVGVWKPGPDRHVSYDGSVVPVAGAGSIKMDILATDTEHSNDYFISLDDYTQQFGENQEFWLVWRQRFDSNYLTVALPHSAGGTTQWKMMDMTEGCSPTSVPPNGWSGYPDRATLENGQAFSSCSEFELIMRRHQNQSVVAPLMYTSCTTYCQFQMYDGASGYTNQNRGHLTPPWLADDSGSPNYSFLNFYPNEWMTFAMYVKLGPLGTAKTTQYGESSTPFHGFTNSIVEFYVGREGQPLKLANRTAPGLVLRQGNNPALGSGYYSDCKYGIVLPTNFCTHLAASSRPDVSTWYSQLTLSVGRPVDPTVAPPSYIPTTPGEVRAIPLSAIANGNNTLYKSVPQSWLTSPTIGQIGDGKAGVSAYDVVYPWAGCAFDHTNRKIYKRGGGHTSSANNGTFTYQFGAPQTSGWICEDISAVADVRSAAYSGGGNSWVNHMYADGRAPSFHTYAGTAVGFGKLWMAGGSPYPAASLDNELWTYDLTTKVHTYIGSIFPGKEPSGGINTIIDEPTGLVFFIDCSYASRYSIYDARNGAWVVQSAGMDITIPNAADTISAAYDTRRKRVLLFGSSMPGGAVLQFNNKTRTFSGTLLALDQTYSAILNADGPSLMYHEERDQFYAMNLTDGAGAGVSQKCIEINPETWAIRQWTWTGDTVSQVGHISQNDADSDAHRGYGYLVPLWGWDALAFFHNVKGEWYAGKLPAPL